MQRSERLFIGAAALLSVLAFFVWTKSVDSLEAQAIAFEKRFSEIQAHQHSHSQTLQALRRDLASQASDSTSLPDIESRLSELASLYNAQAGKISLLLREVDDIQDAAVGREALQKLQIDLERHATALSELRRDFDAATQHHQPPFTDNTTSVLAPNNTNTTTATTTLDSDAVAAHMLYLASVLPSRVHQASTKGLPMPDKSDEDCGLLYLFELTDTQLVATGEGLSHATTGEPAVFWVHKYGKCLEQCMDLDVWARLVGPNLVVADVEAVNVTTFRVSYTVFDPGEYMLQVKLYWLNGDRDINDEGNTTYFGGQKMHGSGFSGQCDELSHIAGSPFWVSATGDSWWQRRLAGPLLPYCTKGNEPGVWVKQDPSQADWCKQSGERMCTGNDAFLHDTGFYEQYLYSYDPLNINRDWLWVPLSCRLHYYTADDLLTCFERSGFKRIAVMGDSISRNNYEALAAVFKMTASSRVIIDHLDFGFFQLKYFGHNADAIEHTQRNLIELCTHFKPDVMMGAPGMAHHTWRHTEQQYRDFLSDFKAVWLAFRNSECSSIKRWIWFSWPAPHGPREDNMTWKRYLKFTSMTRAVFTDELGWEEFSAWLPSVGRPESSYDRVHYLSEGMKRNEWEGSVAKTGLQIGLNVLCNAGLNGATPHGTPRQAGTDWDSLFNRQWEKIELGNRAGQFFKVLDPDRGFHNLSVTQAP